MNTSELRQLFSTDQLSDTRESRLVYSLDASNLAGDCLAVIWPVHVEQVCALVEWANREEIDLVPRGAGTGLCGGATPQSSIVVDFSRLTGVGSLDIEKRSIHVSAGTVSGALNRWLQPQGLFLPVVPGSQRAASIGGMLATNAAGLHAVRYGKMGDWVKQITLVDGQAQVHHLTGKALSDAVGREGVTGFIVHAVLRLTPLPPERTLSLLAYSNISELLVARAKILQDERLTAMEYVNPHAAAAIGWEALHYLMIEFEGTGGEIDSPVRMAELWHQRDSLGPKLSCQGLSVSEDPQIQGDGLIILLDWLDANHIPTFGHLGVGILHPRFRPGDDQILHLYERVQACGGRISGEHGVGLKKRRWISSEFQKEILQLKNQYDPRNILNRGKLC